MSHDLWKTLSLPPEHFLRHVIWCQLHNFNILSSRFRVKKAESWLFLGEECRF